MITVAIVGRANVGKSTLFNRLIGKKQAITADYAGTTRDRLYGRTIWNTREFVLIDTAGLEAGIEKNIEITEQIEVAIEEADLIVFIVDAIAGLTQKDQAALKQIYKAKKPYIVVANKYDGDKYLSNLQEFYKLGEKEIIPISALNGRGTGDLLDRIAQLTFDIESEEEEEDKGEEEQTVKTAIVGRPNVGKSSLLNRIIGKNRAIVSEKAGTTRDITTGEFEHDGRKITFLDTAGVRKRGRVGKVEEGVRAGQIEKYSVIRSMKAIESCDVVLALIDPTEGLTAQDMHVIGFALENLKSVIVVVNKWDLAEEDQNKFLKYLQKKLVFMPYAPVIFVSAKNGKNVEKLPELIIEVASARNKRVKTNELNIILKQSILMKSPPPKRGILPKINYVTQADVNPPTFVFFTNHPDLIHFSYVRYLENQIRKNFDFNGTPINIIFKKKSE
jgi:GTP-binding protein